MPDGLSVSVWEARVLGKLGSHPNIATVLDRWEEDGGAYMTSIYLTGGSLKERIADHHARATTMPVDDLLRIGTEIADGLSHIHSRELLYRDLQPHNVLFDELDGRVRLVDFDTACVAGDPDRVSLAGREVVAYLAPEELGDMPVDERADLYSLGATLYEMSVGTPPYGLDRSENLAHRASHEQLSLDREELPDGLRAIVLSLLASEPDERPPSATSVADTMKQLHAKRSALERLLASEETANLEFKGSLRVPVDGNYGDRNKHEREELERALEYAVTKSIAAFLNTDGGTLVIGCQEGGLITGIETDYPRLKKDKQSRDGWCLAFDDVVSRDLGTGAMGCIDVELEPVSGGTVAEVRCKRCPDAAWHHTGDVAYIRRVASTAALTPRETVDWYFQRFRDQEHTKRPSERELPS